MRTQPFANGLTLSDATAGAAVADTSMPSSSVTTRMKFAAAPERVWSVLLFYEQLEQRPPFYLRWLLPVPIGTEGRKSDVGDEARCLYVGGHLIKRVTRIEPGRVYEFAVVEQELAVGHGMRLENGAYELRPLPGGGTDVSVRTRYTGGRSPRWLWRAIEAQVCHLFHRHILRAMRAKVDR